MFHAGLTASEARERRRRCSTALRSPTRPGHAPLPAPALRRPAAARRHRHGLRRQPDAARPRRADHGPRRDGRGGDPRPVAALRARPRRGHPVHQPQSRPGRAHVRSGRRPVRRPPGRGGAGAASCSPTRATPTRAGLLRCVPRLGHTQDRRRGSTPSPARCPRSAPTFPAALRDALRARRASLPQRSRAPRARRASARPLLFPCGGAGSAAGRPPRPTAAAAPGRRRAARVDADQDATVKRSTRSSPCDDVTLERRRGRGLRPGRRIRQRQDDARLLSGLVVSPTAGRSSSTARRCRRELAERTRHAQARPDGLPEPRHDPEPPPHASARICGRSARKLGGLAARAPTSARRLARSVRLEPRHLDGSPHSSPAARAARRDRAGLRRRPALVVSTSPLGARRLRAGGDPEPAGRPQARRGGRLHLHLARPRGRPLPRRPHRGMYLGELVELGPAEAVFPRAAPPVHGGAALGRSRPSTPTPRPRIRLTGPIPSRRASDGLPLPHPLPPVRRGL